MKYFDAHTHVHFAAYGDETNEVITRAHEAGVGMNLVGTQFDTSSAGVELAEKYDEVWATIGLHPVHTSKSYHDEKELGEGGKEFTSRGEVFDSKKYEALAQSKKVIAVGECGLDYYRLDDESKKRQEDAFIQQIELANLIQKPLMLHIRSSPKTVDAYVDAIQLLKAHARVMGDVHFFAGDWNIAKQFLDFGFTLSFTGVVTFTHDYDEVIKNAPLDMLLTETDAPYVTPVPFRGKRNEPAYIPYIVNAIAGIRGESEDVVAHQIRENVTRVFGV
jgi:TatD DNase family protein